MMRQLLGQMALRLEGQTAFLFRLARAWIVGMMPGKRLARLFTPAAKFAIWAGIPFVAEAMEVLGGIGYCEESELPRLYREMPVNSIWEGSGNIMCLDVMRVLSKQPAAMELLAAECAEVKGQNRHLDRAWRQLQQLLKRPAEEQGRDCPAGLSSWRGGADAAPCFAAAGRSLVPDDARHPRRHTS
nr:hypothetical protein [Klebsiella pneumoniae subsp. pneumoniae]